MPDQRINADGTLPMYRDPQTGQSKPALVTEAVLSGNGEGAGTPGEQGPPGDKGPPGDAGPQGPPGDKGPPGDQGPIGDKGPQGDQGAQGVQGDPGADGAEGPTGGEGPQGPDGGVGPQGPPGDKGPDGDAGAQGIAGPDGLQGPVGDKGPTGDKGPQGDPGAAGVAWQFPIGHILISADNVNPATWLGYGTWVQWGQGRFVLGATAQGEVQAGSATHAHSFTQPDAHTNVPMHTHTTDSQGDHAHAQMRFPTATGGSAGFTVDTSMSGTQAAANNTGSAGAHTHTAAAPAGAVASQPHTNGAVVNGNTDPLSITAFLFKRTA